MVADDYPLDKYRHDRLYDCYDELDENNASLDSVSFLNRIRQQGALRKLSAWSRNSSTTYRSTIASSLDGEIRECWIYIIIPIAIPVYFVVTLRETRGSDAGSKTSDIS